MVSELNIYAEVGTTILIWLTVLMVVLVLAYGVWEWIADRKREKATNEHLKELIKDVDKRRRGG